MRTRLAIIMLLGACSMESHTFTPLGDDASVSDCDAGCAEVSVPVPRLPMNNAYVGRITATNSLRPTFAWEPSTAVGGGAISYELQYSTDATFTSGVTTVPTTTTSHRPTDPLDVSIERPVGARYYWRVRACVDTTCSAYSSPWWVNVGRSDHDIDGDGYAEAAIGAPERAVGGTAFLVMGGPAGSLSFGDLDNGAAAGDAFGGRLDIADVNADGFADLLVGALGGGDNDKGTVLVHFGSPGGLSVAFELTAPAGADEFGVVASAGDVNGDGFTDVIVGAPLADVGVTTLGAGRAYIFFGGPGASFDTEPDVTLDGAAADDGFGIATSSAGDVNGDGYADVIVGAWGNDAGGAEAGRAYVFLGGTGSFDTSADGTVTGAAPGDQCGWSVASAEDVNADGFADVVVGSFGNGAGGAFAGSAGVYFGAPGSLFDDSPEATIIGEAGDLLGFSLAGAGDVNADGFADVVIGAAGDGVGRADVYFGGNGDTFDTAIDGGAVGAAAGAYLGIAVSGGGDLNGDGFADLVVGATPALTAETQPGNAYFYLGAAGPTFDGTADGYQSTSTGDRFGVAVAL